MLNLKLAWSGMSDELPVYSPSHAFLHIRGIMCMIVEYAGLAAAYNLTNADKRLASMAQTLLCTAFVSQCTGCDNIKHSQTKVCVFSVCIFHCITRRLVVKCVKKYAAKKMKLLALRTIGSSPYHYHCHKDEYGILYYFECIHLQYLELFESQARDNNNNLNFICIWRLT